MKEIRYFLYFYTIMVFLNVYTFSKCNSHGLKRRNSSPHAHSSLGNVLNLPRLQSANSLDAKDIFVEDYLDNLRRNSRSAASTPPSLDSPIHGPVKPAPESLLLLQQQLNSSEYSHEPHIHEDGEDVDPAQPKFKIRKHAVVKTQDSNVNRGASNDTIPGSPAVENNDKNSTRAVDAMLTILQVTPALTREVYRCLKESPAYQTMMKSLQNSIHVKGSNGISNNTTPAP